MTTIESSSGTATVDAGDDAIVAAVESVAGWLTTTDHKRIGRMFVGTGLVGALAAAVVGIVLGIERADSSAFVIEAGALQQLFEAQRLALSFGTLLPLAIGLCLAAVPLQLGARSLAFPRLALTGFYTWLGGMVLSIVALANNGGAGGGDEQMVELSLAALGLMSIGIAAAAGSVATSVFTTRAPGMTMRRVPLFSWSALVASLGFLLVLPVLLGAIIFLFVDHRNAQLVFGGPLGISPWIDWFFTQPTSYLAAIPAIGFAAEMIPVTFNRRQVMRGVTFAGIAFVAVGALAGSTQQQIHDLNFDTSSDVFVRDLVPFLIFNGLPVLGVVIVMGLGALTAMKARPSLNAPFVFGFLGLGMIFVGMLGGLAYPIRDLELVGTVFEEGSVTYVTYGTVLATLGAITYWAPKWWGRLVPTKAVMPLAGLGLLATVLATLPYYIAGFLDQPGAFESSGGTLFDVSPAANYADSGVNTVWSVLVLVGHGLLALTVVAFIGLLLKTATGSGEAAGDDPWNAHTLEWAATSPAPADNYADVPVIRSAEPLLDLKPGSDS